MITASRLKFVFIFIFVFIFLFAVVSAQTIGSGSENSVPDISNLRSQYDLTKPDSWNIIFEKYSLVPCGDLQRDEFNAALGFLGVAKDKINVENYNSVRDRFDLMGSIISITSLSGRDEDTKSYVLNPEDFNSLSDEDKPIYEFDGNGDLTLKFYNGRYNYDNSLISLNGDLYKGVSFRTDKRMTEDNGQLIEDATHGSNIPRFKFEFTDLSASEKIDEPETRSFSVMGDFKVLDSSPLDLNSDMKNFFEVLDDGIAVIRPDEGGRIFALSKGVSELDTKGEVSRMINAVAEDNEGGQRDSIFIAGSFDLNGKFQEISSKPKENEPIKTPEPPKSFFAQLKDIFEKPLQGESATTNPGLGAGRAGFGAGSINYFAINPNVVGQAFGEMIIPTSEDQDLIAQWALLPEIKSQPFTGVEDSPTVIAASEPSRAMMRVPAPPTYKQKEPVKVAVSAGNRGVSLSVDSTTNPQVSNQDKSSSPVGIVIEPKSQVLITVPPKVPKTEVPAGQAVGDAGDLVSPQTPQSQPMANSILVESSGEDSGATISLPADDLPLTTVEKPFA